MQRFIATKDGVRVGTFATAELATAELRRLHPVSEFTETVRRETGRTVISFVRRAVVPFLPPSDEHTCEIRTETLSGPVMPVIRPVRRYTDDELKRAERERRETTSKSAPVKRQHTGNGDRPKVVSKPTYSVPLDSTTDMVSRPTKGSIGRLVTIRPEHRTHKNRSRFMKFLKDIGLNHMVVETTGYDHNHNRATGEYWPDAALVPSIILVQGEPEKFVRLSNHPAVAKIEQVMTVRVGMRAAGSGELKERHKREFRPLPREEREARELIAAANRREAVKETRELREAERNAKELRETHGPDVPVPTAAELAYQAWADGERSQEDTDRDMLELVGLQKMGFANLTPEQWERAARLLERLEL